VVPLQEELIGSSRPSLQVLQTAVGLVFLIGCLNLANLMMARLASRRSEIAIRTTLGAGRLRLIRQFLTESLLLSAVGGLLGLFLAAATLRVCAGFGPEILPRLAYARLDGTVLVFIAAVSLGTALLFGLVPAVSISRGPLHEALKSAGPSLTEGKATRTVKQSLVILQVALTLVLLVAAGVLLKSFWRLSSTDPGYDPRNVLQVRIELPSGRYPYPKTWPIRSWPLVTGLMNQIHERIQKLPGVDDASLSLHSPLMGGWTTRVTVVGRPIPAPGEQEEAEFSPVDEDYFTCYIPVSRALRLDPVAALRSD
jgi:putative ABC transport system permease protein